MVYKQFFKGSESKYSRLCGLDQSQLMGSAVKAATGNMKGQGCITLKIRSQT